MAFIWDLFDGDFSLAMLLHQPFTLLIAGFQIWMLIHAIMRKNWMWVAFIAIFSIFSALWYFFAVYRLESSSSTGFELPGAQNRKRIKELQAQIHHLDKAHHHFQLGDIYFSQAKYKEAEESYRKAHERDKEDIDIQSHLGQCLLRQGKTTEALPFLHGVCSVNRQHEYGYTLMALAETFSALGRKEDSLKVWRNVLEHYRYDRARVQMAELCHETGDNAKAITLLDEVIEDWDHSTAFDRRKNRVWFKKARALRGKLG